MVDEGKCELCGRTETLHRHHIVPRVIWRRLKRRGKVKGKAPLAMLCLHCSRQVHAMFSDHELAEFGTIEKLKEQPTIKEYIGWVRRFGAFSKTPPPRLSKRLKEFRP